MNNITTKDLSFIAILTAVVTVATFFGITSPLDPTSLIHLGSFAALTIALRYGKTTGALAGGLGMAIFDLIGGWLVWAPVTLVARLIGGYVAGMIAFDPKTNIQGGSLKRNMLAILAAAVIMLVSYYVYRGVLYGWYSAYLGLAGDSLQFVLALGALYLVPKLILLERAYKE